MASTSIPPHIFWYELTLTDLEPILKHIRENKKDKWEQTRLIIYFNQLPNIEQNKRKNLTPHSFMPFPWDDEKESSLLPLTRDEINNSMQDFITSIEKSKD